MLRLRDRGRGAEVREGSVHIPIRHAKGVRNTGGTRGSSDGERAAVNSNTRAPISATPPPLIKQTGPHPMSATSLGSSPNASSVRPKRGLVSTCRRADDLRATGCKTCRKAHVASPPPHEAPGTHMTLEDPPVAPGRKPGLHRRRVPRCQSPCQLRGQVSRSTSSPCRTASERWYHRPLLGREEATVARI